MSIKSNVHSRNSETSQQLINGCESSSSSFSLSKTRKVHRRTNKKKITKIVHTYCFLRIGKDGRQQPFYMQQVTESALKDPRSVRNLALRLHDDQSSKMVQDATNSTDFKQKEPSETMVKVEQDLALPAYQSFQPAQFFYIF